MITVQLNSDTTARQRMVILPSGVALSKANWIALRANRGLMANSSMIGLSYCLFGRMTVTRPVVLESTGALAARYFFFRLGCRLLGYGRRDTAKGAAGVAAGRGAPDGDHLSVDVAGHAHITTADDAARDGGPAYVHRTAAERGDVYLIARVDVNVLICHDESRDIALGVQNHVGTQDAGFIGLDVSAGIHRHGGMGEIAVIKRQLQDAAGVSENIFAGHHR